MKTKLQALAALAAFATVPAVSFAAAVDVDDVVTDIGAQLVPVGLIGSAILLLIVAIKAYKWVRRAM